MEAKLTRKTLNRLRCTNPFDEMSKDSCLAELDALEAENNRLKEIMQNICENHCDGDVTDGCFSCEWYKLKGSE